jgi:hypothetical protein
VHVLRTDRGGEFIDELLADFIISKGIQHQFTVPYNKEQNGKAERLNQTLNNIVRALLLQARFPKRLWSEAMKIATYIHNVTYSKDIGCTPFEMLHGVVPDLTDLRIFGCLTYYLIAPELRQKVDPKCGVGFYLGPEQGTKGYRVLVKDANSGRLKVKIYRDIVTVERYSLNTDLPIALQLSSEDAEELGPLGILGEQLPEEMPHLPQPPEGEPVRRMFPKKVAPHVLELMGGSSPEGGLMESTAETEVSLPSDQQNLLEFEHSGGVRNADTSGQLMQLESGHPLQGSRSLESPAVPSMNEPRVVPRGIHQRPGTGQVGQNGSAPASNASQRGVKRLGGVYCVRLIPPAKCMKVSGEVVFRKYAQRVCENLADGFAHKAEISWSDDFEPQTYEQAMACPHSEQWREAIQSEYSSLIENHTWDTVERESNMKVLPCRWIFKLKRDAEGQVVRYKARLVAGGHRQVLGVDYDETFSPVSKYTTMRVELAVASRRKWKVFQCDVKTAFLHGDMDEFDIYMALPKGFEIQGVVAKMRKCMYGLHQAPRRWNAKESDFFRKIGLEQNCADPSLWIKRDHPKVYLCTVVDDMLITSPEEKESLRIMDLILKEFPGTSGPANQYSGLKIQWDSNGCAAISQKAHVDKTLARFDDGKLKFRTLPMAPGVQLRKEGESFENISDYAGLIGSLLYIACSSRPDIASSVNRLAKYMSCPTQAHWTSALNLLGYLKLNPDMVIKYGDSDDFIGYCDSDYGGDLDNRRSHTGWVFMLYGGAICWQSKCQPTVAVSTVEAEYQAVASAAREALWLRQLLADFDIDCTPTKIMCDSSGAIASIKNPKITQRTKHIDIAHHFVRERHLRGEIQLEWIPGKDNVADVLTKPVPKDKHQQCIKGMGMRKS